MKVVPPKALNEFFETELSELEGFNDEKMHQVSRAFYERFNALDYLPSPFRKDLFFELGAYLKSFKTESMMDREKSVFHFGFSLLDDPDKVGSFILSSVGDETTIKSKAKFTDFVKKKIATCTDTPATSEIAPITMQSMETAPKDGSIILLETPQGYFTAKWMGEYTDAWAPCRWQMMKGNKMSSFGTLYDEVEDPIGWAPLELRQE